MKIGTSNIHNAIKFTVSIAYDAYVDIFYGRLLFHQGRFVFVSKNILLVILGKSAITHSKVGQSSPNPKKFEEHKNLLGQVIYQKCVTVVVSEKTA